VHVEQYYFFFFAGFFAAFFFAAGINSHPLSIPHLPCRKRGKLYSWFTY
jgi:hypothetical protein